MQEPIDPYAEWVRPLPGQDREIAQSYLYEKLRDNAIRAHTNRAHADEVSLWLASLSLLTHAFEPNRVYHTGTPEPGSPEDSDEARTLRGAFALRMQLLSLASRAGKQVLDLTLSAYYTEAWTLLRTMLDGWARCLYVRLSPKEHTRWYNPAPSAPYKAEPSWGMISGIVTSRGSAEDKASYAAAELRWELLQIGAHPSGEGLTQVRNDELNIMMYRPEYHHDFCMHTFSAGVFVMRALLREIELLGSHQEWWILISAKHARNVASLENSIQPVLQEMERRIKKQRAVAEQKRQAQKARS